MADGGRVSAHNDHEAARSVARRSRNWPRRALSGPVSALIWALRFYVVGMLAVVAVQLVRLV